MENQCPKNCEQPFGSEFILHKLTEKYIKNENLFSLRYVGSEIQYNKLRIDTLAYDEDKNTFVIIEYKNIKMGSKVIDQVQGYYNLIKDATEEDDSEVDIPQELAKRLGKNKKDIDFKNMRAIIIGPGLKVDFEKNTIPEYLEVYVVSLCKCNEECYVTYEKKNSKEIMNCDSKEIRLEVDPKDLEITKEDVLKYKSPEIKTLYNDFERSLKQFYGVYNDDKESLKQSNVIKFKYLVDAVSIKVQNKSICNISVNESIKIYFYSHKLNKINKMLDKDNCRKKNLRNIAYLSTGGPLVYFELTLTPCEIEYAIEVIKQIADAKNGGNKKMNEYTICPACHTKNSVKEKYCRDCGQKLIEEEEKVIALENKLEIPKDKIILLDLNYTLISNSWKIRHDELPDKIFNRKYEHELVNKIKDNYVILITASPDYTSSDSLKHIEENTDLKISESYWNFGNQSPPELKEHWIKKAVFPKHGDDSSKYLAIESNEDTREMYARFGIEARPKWDFI